MYFVRSHCSFVLRFFSFLLVFLSLKCDGEKQVYHGNGTTYPKNNHGFEIRTPDYILNEIYKVFTGEAGLL